MGRTASVESHSPQEPLARRSWESLRRDDSDDPANRIPESDTKVCARQTCEASETSKASEASEIAAADDALRIDDTLRIDDDECSICLDTLKNGFRTPCGHIFCASCLARALLRNDSCPICRSRGVHTCARPSASCPLCVVGHKPGVVMPNPIVSPRRTLRFSETAPLWCGICSLFGALVLTGYMMDALGVAWFIILCFWITAANAALVSNCMLERCMPRIWEQLELRRASWRGRSLVRPAVQLRHAV